MGVERGITNSHVPSLPLNDPGISQRKPPGEMVGENWTENSEK
jgi:hypothetical protein